MDLRKTKQLIYGGAYLFILLWVLVSLYFFFVKPAPSCFDKKQNQDEEGVDCGGVCAQICLPANLQPIGVIDKVQIYFPSPNKVTLLARLKNPNEAFGAVVSYVFTVYDREGRVMASDTQEAIIYSSQVRFVIAPSLDIPDALNLIGRADLRFQRMDWQPEATLQKPQVTVRDQTSQRNDNFTEVSGNVVNEDIVDVTRVTVLAVFFNQFQIPIGAARTELLDLRSGETRNFTIIHPMLPSLFTDRTQVFVTTD